MDTVREETMYSDQQIEMLKKYGESGGTDNRGILTMIKADELPDEAASVFSNAPFEFEESVNYLWDDTQKLYYHACTANRFSDKYLTYSAELEKGIRQLGSYCLTKTVLEQKGMKLPKLSELSVNELVCMVSFHLRKTHAAFEGIYKDNGFLGLTYLKQEFRWVALGNRLKATEVKIQKIKDGKLNADDLLKEHETFSGSPRTNENSDREMIQRLQVNPAALPINGSMARKMLSLEKSAQKNAERFRKERIRKIKQAEKNERELDRMSGIKPSTIELSKDNKAQIKQQNAANLRKEITEMEMADTEKQNPQSESEPVKNPGELTEAEARKLLMDKAMKQGDQKAVTEIPLEDSRTFYQRWLRFIEEIRERKNTPRSGPSPQIRKALRDKRKKKNR